MKLKIQKMHPEVKMPTYAHAGDVGLDMFSLEDKMLAPGERYVFFCGFACEFPNGYAAIVKDKGSTAKAGLHVMGGVFDAGYRGEYNALVVNLGDEPYRVEKGDKIAQLIIYPIEIVDIEEAEILSESARGEGRFGSTGKQ